jgi:sialidase-1
MFEYGDHVIHSENHGQTWELGGTVPGLGLDEPQVVELETGNLMMNMRSIYGNLRVVSLSKDAGQTWSVAWRDETLIEPPCQASIRRYTQRPKWKNRRLLFSNPASPKKRINMTVRLSYDEGQTWTVSKQVYAGPSAYSCLAALSDMTIGCLYERGKADAYEKITLARFSLQWLTDGADRVE